MFQITVQGETLAELGAKLLAAGDALLGGAVTTAEKPKDKPAVKDKPKPEPEAEGEEMEYGTHVQPHVVKLSKLHGREAAVDILSEFEDENGEPCVSAKAVQPSDWPALVKKVQARQKKLDKAKAAAEDE